MCRNLWWDLHNHGEETDELRTREPQKPRWSPHDRGGTQRRQWVSNKIMKAWIRVIESLKWWIIIIKHELSNVIKYHWKERLTTSNIIKNYEAKTLPIHLWDPLGDFRWSRRPLAKPPPSRNRPRRFFSAGARCTSLPGPFLFLLVLSAFLNGRPIPIPSFVLLVSCKISNIHLQPPTTVKKIPEPPKTYHKSPLLRKKNMVFHHRKPNKVVPTS